MNFKSIAIVDDSIGGVNLLNKLKISNNENYIYFADMKNFPLGLWNRDLYNKVKNITNILEEMNLKCVIFTNPLISIYTDIKIPKIDGINTAIDSLKNDDLLVLASRRMVKSGIFKSIKRCDCIDASMLINLLHDGDNNPYIIKTLIKEYIGEYKGNVLLFDSNLSVFKNYFSEIKGINVYTLEDFIIKDFYDFLSDDIKNIKFNRSKIKYLVSDYRIAFYLSCEAFYEGKYSAVKKIKKDFFNAIFQKK